jgi:hypothetical protein
MRLLPGVIIIERSTFVIKDSEYRCPEKNLPIFVLALGAGNVESVRA